MPRKRKKTRRRRTQRGGAGDDLIQPLKKNPIYKNVETNSNIISNNLEKSKTSSRKLKNMLTGFVKKFTFKDMFLWVLLIVALIIYTISITTTSKDNGGCSKGMENYMLVITYSVLLTCTLFIGISYYLSRKSGGEDVTSSIINIFKTMIPLLSSVSGLIYIIITYSNNLKTISNIGKHVEELSTFNNFIAVMSFLQVYRLIIYFKEIGTERYGQEIFDYVIFTLCFIIQIAFTIMISNKLESYKTDG